MERFVVSIDPGHKKCGILLADLGSEVVLDGRVVMKHNVKPLITYWLGNKSIEAIILGNGTSSKYWYSELRHFAPITLVDERGTTLLARERYWELWPPSYLLRWIPKGLMIPKENLDGIAAMVLLEKHLDTKLSWQGVRNFRT